MPTTHRPLHRELRRDYRGVHPDDREPPDALAGEAMDEEEVRPLNAAGEAALRAGVSLAARESELAEYREAKARLEGRLNALAFAAAQHLGKSVPALAAEIRETLNAHRDLLMRGP